MFRVYVGNLPYPARQAELKGFFVSGGIAEDKISETIVPLTEDNRSKGFGFAEFTDEESYQKALALNGQSMDGRALRINEARPREERRGGRDEGMAQTSQASTAQNDTSDMSDDGDDDDDDNAVAKVSAGDDSDSDTE